MDTIENLERRIRSLELWRKQHDPDWKEPTPDLEVQQQKADLILLLRQQRRGTAQGFEALRQAYPKLSDADWDDCVRAAREG